MSKREFLEVIDDWRYRARMLCMVRPDIWTAMHGVSLSEYLSQLDKLEKLIRKMDSGDVSY